LTLEIRNLLILKMTYTGEYIRGKMSMKL